jgi:hypothetical protein
MARGKAKKANEYRATKKGISMGERTLYKELGRQYRVDSGMKNNWKKVQKEQRFGEGVY